MKQLIILFLFCVLAAALKPMPSVTELSRTINATCRDVCKGK